MKKAVIIFSGGLDSTTILYYAISQGFEAHPITFDYGQRHRVEIEVAKKTAASLELSHKIFSVSIADFGGSSLTDKTMNLPSYQNIDQVEKKVYSSYVPARNMIFLTLALAYAEGLGANDIFIGPNKDDFFNYPDCRPDFYKKFTELALLGTKMGSEGGEINIHTPLIEMYKPEIIKLGLSLGVDYSKTFSCYNPTTNGNACGKCLSCTVRKNAFKLVGIEDKLVYES